MDKELNNTLSKYKVDSHHKIEQFIVVFLVFVFALTFILGAAFKQYNDNKKLFLTSQAKYTDRTLFSLSKNIMLIDNVFRNENFTKTFVLLHTDDMRGLNLNAKDYSVFMTNGSGDKIEGSPTASVYIFGNTGYMGIAFNNAAGFKSQLYDITFRQGKEDKLRPGYGQWFEGIIDESDKRFNQAHFRVNFGGTAGIKADFLEKESLSIIDAYNETVISQDYKEHKNSLNQSLIMMNMAINNIHDKENALRQFGIVVPDLPNYIAGDFVTDDPEKAHNIPMRFTDAMLDTSNVKGGFNDNASLNINSKEQYDEVLNADKLYLVTDFVHPGGIQYNFQEMQLKDHKLSDYIGENTSYSEFKHDMSIEKEQNDIFMNFDASTYYANWYKDDGTSFQYDESDIASASTWTLIKEYCESVSGLMNLKKSYQCESLLRLLEMEASTVKVANVTSVNPDALVVY